MKYFNYEIETQLGEKMNAALLQYFPDNTWGVDVCTDIDGKVDTVTINKVVTHSQSSETWTYFATITDLQGDGTDWEVSKQFIPIDEAFCDKWGDEYRKWIGTKQTGVNVYGHYKHFKAACHCVASASFRNDTRKVIEAFV